MPLNLLYKYQYRDKLEITLYDQKLWYLNKRLYYIDLTDEGIYAALTDILFFNLHNLYVHKQIANSTCSQNILAVMLLQTFRP